MIYSYTDWHVVDEDERAIVDQGGESGLYWRDTTSGVFLRVMDDSPSNLSDTVAFEQKINRTYTPFGDAYIFISVEADLR